MRNLFTTVKAAVTTRQAAEYYGLKVSRNGMTCCPFHDDRHPSMKVDERYYCFGCHETGDVIDFTAKLFGLTPYEAAQKLVSEGVKFIEICSWFDAERTQSVIDAIDGAVPVGSCGL